MGYSHIQIAMRNTQLMFMGGYLYYIYVFVSPLSGRNILFFTFNRSVSNAQFFLLNICLQWYQKKNKEQTWRKLIRLHIKTRPPITWLSNITSQILKFTQGKQIFSILYHIDGLSKYLLEEINLIEAEIILDIYIYIYIYIYTSVSFLIFVLLLSAVYAVWWKIFHIVPKYENRF